MTEPLKQPVFEHGIVQSWSPHDGAWSVEFRKDHEDGHSNWYRLLRPRDWLCPHIRLAPGQSVTCRVADPEHGWVEMWMPHPLGDSLLFEDYSSTPNECKIVRMLEEIAEILKHQASTQQYTLGSLHQILPR